MNLTNTTLEESHGIVKDKAFGIKVGFVFFIFAVNFTGGLIPILCKRVNKNKNILSILNCFAGGVFLAMALCHI
jgi:hypothetical protein